ncbi:MAG: DNA polymerase I, partial [Patescibacteria group bacterium]
NTKVLSPHQGLSETILYGEPEVKEKFGGLAPKQLIDYKGLRGDASDNIPGVRGIGEKGAIELLNNFGSLENIYRQIDSEKIKDRTRQLLKEQKDQALMSKKIATIIRDVPIDFQLAACKFQALDQDAVVDVFQKMGFKRLMNQLAGLAKSGLIAPAGQGNLFDREPPPTSPFAKGGNDTSTNSSTADGDASSPLREENPNATIENHQRRASRLGAQNYRLLTAENLEKFLSDLKKQPEFCFDTETTGLDPFQDKLLGISFCWQTGEASYLPVGLINKKIKKDLLDIFSNEKIKKIGHNLKFDGEVLNTYFGENSSPLRPARNATPASNALRSNAGWHNVAGGRGRLEGVVSGLYFDTMVASYLLNPGHRQHGLDTLAFVEFGYQMQPIEELIGQGKSKISLAEVPLEKVSWYSGEDADLTFRLYQKFAPELAKENLNSLFETLEMPLVEVLAAIEKNGVKIDGRLLKDLSAEFEKRIKTIEKKTWKLAGTDFNLASPKQLKEVLFDKLKIDGHGLAKTKTGISTGASELEKLAGWLRENKESKDKIEIIDLLMEFRELSKLKSTYLDALPTLISPLDGRVHTSFNQTVTATGRLSSSEPNLQNIPIRTETGGPIRRAFIAEPGFKIIKADYSQIELRIIASLANDRAMLKIFNSGGDIHTQTAAIIHGLEPSEVTKEIRRTAKEINFGVLYGMGAWGLSSRTGLSNAEAQKFIYKYFDTFKEVKKWLDETVEIARDKGYVETLYGRRRYLPEINSSISQVKSSAERMAVNMPIQGCLPKHVKILTSGGYISIGELYSNKNKPKLVWDGEKWQKYKVLNRGRAQLAQISFSNGQTLDCDIRHEILCLNDEGYFWKKFSELHKNDKVCFSFPTIKEFKDKQKLIKYSYSKNRQTFNIKSVDDNFWYWLGYYYGDGHFTRRFATRATRYDLAYTFGSHEEIKLKICEDYFTSIGLNPRIRKLPPSTKKAKHKWELVITSIGFGKFLEHIGVKSNENAKNKRLLSRIFQETKLNRIAFIKGFFAADGCLGKTRKYMPNFHLCQKEILEDLQLLLKTLGIESSLLGPYICKEKVSYRLDMLRNSFQKIILGENIKLSYRTACIAPRFLMDEIIRKYPKLTRKNLDSRSDYVLYNRWKNGGHSTIHQIFDILKRNDLRIETPIYSWFSIKNIKIKNQKETTYTLSVENSHKFDSEGVISKNTAADLIKLAMIAIQQELPRVSPKTRMILQVHDELVFEAPAKDVKKVAKFIADKMSSVMKLRAPIEVEVSSGDNWGETSPLSSRP